MTPRETQRFPGAGAAYVYRRDDAGTPLDYSDDVWLQEARLTASDPGTGDNFGQSVSVSGNTVVVGSPSDGVAPYLNSGSVYVFTHSGGGWVEQAKLEASDPADFDQLGVSVSVSGDTVVAGSSSDDDNGFNSGSAYVFIRSGTTWSQQAKLTASDADSGDRFGYTVSVSGETAVVGSPNNEDQGRDTGSAYIFTRSGNLWNEQAKLTASDAASGDYFGVSVSVSGETVVVGSDGDINDGGTYAGSAYVFTQSGGTWNEQAKLTASDAGTSDRFGRSVAVSGDTVVVGSLFDNDSGSNSGSAYVFARSGAIWSEQAKLTARDAAKEDWFGASVAVSGNTVVVGSPQDDVIVDGLSVEDAESAYVFVPESVPVDYDFTSATFAAAEGDSTNTTTAVMLTRSDASVAETVQVTLTDGTATAVSDFTDGPISVFFEAGELTKPVPIEILGDLTVEADQSLTLSLTSFSESGQVGTTNPTTTFTITNDDTATISIADASVAEGSGGTTELVFTITSTNPSEEDLTVQVDTAEILGQALGGGVDFTDIVSGTATIAGDSVSTSTSVTVVLNADYFAEPDETLEVNLSNPQFDGSSDANRVEIGDAQAIGTILDDDLENSVVVGDCPCGGDLRRYPSDLRQRFVAG